MISEQSGQSAADTNQPCSKCSAKLVGEPANTPKALSRLTSNFCHKTVLFLLPYHAVIYIHGEKLVFVK